MPTSDADITDNHAHLMNAIGSLPDDELLALAYTFSQNEMRLRVYLELFRSRSGERAQFAASLLCFDLARRGDAAMGVQFGYLRGTLQALRADPQWVMHLMGDHAYLCEVWGQCASVLDQQNDAAMDAPGAAEAWGFLRADDAPIAGSLALLNDEDVAPEALEVDYETMWRSYVAGCDQFFGGGAGKMVYDGSMGFRMRGHHGQARAQAFLNVLDGCYQFVTPAKGMRPLLLLSWGLSLKTRGLLGQANKRRHHLLGEGLQAFAQAGPHVAEVAAVLGPLYADPGTWESIAALVTGYVRWCHTLGGLDLSARAHVDAYLTQAS
jgi:hypothetical protein